MSFLTSQPAYSPCFSLCKFLVCMPEDKLGYIWIVFCTGFYRRWYIIVTIRLTNSFNIAFPQAVGFQNWIFLKRGSSSVLNANRLFCSINLSLFNISGSRVFFTAFMEVELPIVSKFWKWADKQLTIGIIFEMYTYSTFLLKFILWRTQMAWTVFQAYVSLMRQLYWARTLIYKYLTNYCQRFQESFHHIERTVPSGLEIQYHFLDFSFRNVGI